MRVPRPPQSRIRWPWRGRGRLPRPHWKAVFFAATAVVIVGIMAWALLGSTLLVVRSVRVAGTGQAVSAGQVLGAARIAHGQPLIWVDTGAISRRVEQLRQVRSAQVSKDWPSTLVITIRLRKPVFALPVHGGYALVDAFGVSVRDVARRPPGLPLLTVNTTGGSLKGSPAVRAAAAVLAELPRHAARQVRDVTTGGPNDVSVKLANGAIVVWGGPERARVKARELRVLMRRQARVYDVSGVGTAMTKG
ncbi:MAG TPA: FtsQ-type POTRA domain-containing protein [Streptosporangiaceae bacterium]|jgi:cell division protein FtsQ|nr:FtsQ-type POTRA domain-containing protein [Streptosporangiaceae bacterium]